MQFMNCLHWSPGTTPTIYEFLKAFFDNRYWYENHDSEYAARNEDLNHILDGKGGGMYFVLQSAHFS